MKLSKNLSLAEVMRSATAQRHGIVNEPTPEHLQNLMRIAEHIFQPIRDFLGSPLFVSSGYRSERLNQLIGGSHKYVDGKYIATSQHCKGQALDLDQGDENWMVFNYIKQNLNFDQLIWEFGDEPCVGYATGLCNPSWVHVSYVSPEKNRNQILVAYKYKGKTSYRVWSDQED
jgi:hypothetical protein